MGTQNNSMCSCMDNKKEGSACNKCGRFWQDYKGASAFCACHEKNCMHKAVKGGVFCTTCDKPVIVPVTSQEPAVKTEPTEKPLEELGMGALIARVEANSQRMEGLLRDNYKCIKCLKSLHKEVFDALDVVTACVESLSEGN